MLRIILLMLLQVGACAETPIATTEEQQIKPVNILCRVKNKKDKEWCISQCPNQKAQEIKEEADESNDTILFTIVCQLSDSRTETSN